MHDETFLTTQGTVRFHLSDSKTVDAKLGDLVTVPTRCERIRPACSVTLCDAHDPTGPHTFSNPFEEEAKFINTYTPASVEAT